VRGHLVLCTSLVQTSCCCCCCCWWWWWCWCWEDEEEDASVAAVVVENDTNDILATRRDCGIRRGENVGSIVRDNASIPTTPRTVHFDRPYDANFDVDVDFDVDADVDADVDVDVDVDADADVNVDVNADATRIVGGARRETEQPRPSMVAVQYTIMMAVMITMMHNRRSKFKKYFPCLDLCLT